MTVVLDLGCGPNKHADAFGVDVRPGPGVDLVHDLDHRPWPIDDNRFDRVHASHIVEHVDDLLAFFAEVHRVSRDGALVTIVTPHYTNRCAYIDPTHRRYLSARFLDFVADAEPWTPRGRFAVARSWLGQHHHDYAPLLPPGSFSIESRRLSFARFFRALGIEALANWKIDAYEFYFAFLFPARDITATLRVKKGTAR